MESKLGEDRLQEIPVNSVICLLKVYFEGHETSLNLSSFEAMKKLMHNKLVFNYPQFTLILPNEGSSREAVNFERSGLNFVGVW